MLFQRQHRQHRGVAGGADRHRVARRHALGQPHQPVALDAGLLGIGAEMGLAHAPAVADHLVAGLPLRMRGLFDGAGEIDAGDHRETPHHRRLAGDGKAILVVQRRPFDRDGDVAFHQFGFVELGERGGGALVRLVDPDRLERSQGNLPELCLSGSVYRIRRAAQPGATTGFSTIGRLISADSTPNSTESHQIGV